MVNLHLKKTSRDNFFFHEMNCESNEHTDFKLQQHEINLAPLIYFTSHFIISIWITYNIHITWPHCFLCFPLFTSALILLKIREQNKDFATMMDQCGVIYIDFLLTSISVRHLVICLGPADRPVGLAGLYFIFKTWAGLSFPNPEHNHFPLFVMIRMINEIWADWTVLYIEVVCINGLDGHTVMIYTSSILIIPQNMQHQWLRMNGNLDDLGRREQVRLMRRQSVSDENCHPWAMRI